MFSIKLNDLNITFYGASHNKTIGIIIDGLKPRFKLDLDLIKGNLKRRKSSLDINTPRVEEDNFEIVSGYTSNQCDGTPLHIIVNNNNYNSNDYNTNIMRPGHGDLSSFLKNDGIVLSGGGAFSGRMTILLVIAGSICEQILKDKYSDLDVVTHIKQYSNIIDDEADDFTVVKFGFPIANKKNESLIINKIKEDVNNKIFLASKLKTVVRNCPKGLGNLYFDSFESTLSRLIFSIPGIKSISFGKADLMLQESLIEELRVENENVISNNVNGGINGGISFDDVDFNVIVKPLVSSIKVKAVEFDQKFKNVEYERNGRHDIYIANRICVVVEAVTYMSIYSLV